MTKNEMRACRREWINSYLRKGYETPSIITMLVRFEEKLRYGQELNAYA